MKIKTRPPSKCLLFTMDSIDSYVQRSKHGGASGEITVRESLVKHLRLVLNVRVDVARSDAEFERVRGSAMGGYAFVVLDAWTWAAKGWVPKPNLRGQEHKVFLLDFFGAEQPTRRGINVPASRILTAFPTFPGNTFLGYAIDKAQLPNTAPGGLLVSKPKKPQGVIWGKDPKHYSGRELVLKAVADVAPLYSTLSVRDAPSKLRAHPNIHFLGHQTKEKWQELLAESMFMLGLGNPLVGPSAVDAVVAGCVYVNPVYDKPVKDVYLSQHPYLEDRVGAPHVCSSKLSDIPAVVSCVRYAVANEVLPLIPAELTEAAYQSRVEDIFAPFVPKPAG